MAILLSTAQDYNTLFLSHSFTTHPSINSHSMFIMETGNPELHQ